MKKELNFKLKPCPFCNGQVRLNQNVCNSFVVITCKDCFAEISRNKNLHDDALNEVVEAWNKRYADECFNQRAAYVKPGNTFKHFKGYFVMIDSISQHTETGETMVNYHHITDAEPIDKIWSRPMSMFLSKVDRSKYPDVKQEYRFELLLDEKNDLPF